MNCTDVTTSNGEAVFVSLGAGGVVQLTVLEGTHEAAVIEMSTEEARELIDALHEHIDRSENY